MNHSLTFALDSEGRLVHSPPSNASAVLVPISEAQTGFTFTFEAMKIDGRVEEGN